MIALQPQSAVRDGHILPLFRHRSSLGTSRWPAGYPGHIGIGIMANASTGWVHGHRGPPRYGFIHIDSVEIELKCKTSCFGQRIRFLRLTRSGRWSRLGGWRWPSRCWGWRAIVLRWRRRLVPALGTWTRLRGGTGASCRASIAGVGGS